MRFTRFIRATGLALVIAICAALLFGFGRLIVGNFNAQALVIVVSTAVWILTVLRNSTVRGGRSIVGISWLCLNAALAIINVDIVLIAMANAICIWLVRSLYLHNSLLVSALDGGLTVASLSIALAVAAATGQVGLAVWCFYLGQAACVLLSSRAFTRASTSDFDSAFDTAQTALRKLSAN